MTDFGLGDDAIREAKLQAALEWHGLAASPDDAEDCGPLPDTTREPKRPSGTKHRLVGVPYPRRPVEQPDPQIVADPVVWCPKCGLARVLAELRTGGLCWTCCGEK